MRTAAHLQQLQGVAVVGNQDLQGRVVNWSIINLDGGQGLGVDKHDCQRRHKVGLRCQGEDAQSTTIIKIVSPLPKLHQQ